MSHNLKDCVFLNEVFEPNAEGLTKLGQLLAKGESIPGLDDEFFSEALSNRDYMRSKLENAYTPLVLKSYNRATAMGYIFIKIDRG